MRTFWSICAVQIHVISYENKFGKKSVIMHYEDPELWSKNLLKSTYGIWSASRCRRCLHAFRKLWFQKWNSRDWTKNHQNTETHKFVIFFASYLLSVVVKGNEKMIIIWSNSTESETLRRKIRLYNLVIFVEINQSLFCLNHAQN